MINFVWEPHTHLPAGTGGTENYTVGQVRELIRRGIPAQIITIGLGTDDGRDEFVDIPFKSLETEADIAQLDDIVVFINGSSDVHTKQPSYIMMHIPPSEDGWNSIKESVADRKVIVPSKFAAHMWADYLDRGIDDIYIAYPFAEPCFATQIRSAKNDKINILFAGRLSAEKGIYTFLEMLHIDAISKNTQLSFTVTTAGSDKPDGKIIRMLVDAHPNVTVELARKTPATMAELMSVSDIVVMPSNSQYWHETFGIVSVEAQHSGCWVIASDDGGLPETDCGSIVLVTPDDAGALARGIQQAVASGPVPAKTRRKAANLFTVEQSVDNLLLVLFPADELVVQPIEKLVLKSSIKIL